MSGLEERLKSNRRASKEEFNTTKEKSNSISLSFTSLRKCPRRIILTWQLKTLEKALGSMLERRENPASKPEKLNIISVFTVGYALCHSDKNADSLISIRVTLSTKPAQSLAVVNHKIKLLTW